jgi:hypothetical protein
MERTIDRTGGAGSVPRLRVGKAIAAIAALAFVAVIGTTVWTFTGGRSVEGPARVGSPIYTHDEATVIGLVADGVLPASVLAREPFRTKQLVAEGLVPSAALDAAVTPVAPLYCPDELATIAAVAAGTIPQETLAGEPYRTKRLIEQGLVPRAAAEPCR